MDTAQTFSPIAYLFNNSLYLNLNYYIYLYVCKLVQQLIIILYSRCMRKIDGHHSDNDCFDQAVNVMDTAIIYLYSQVIS
jgi:hypothetical protein